MVSHELNHSSLSAAFTSGDLLSGISLSVFSPMWDRVLSGVRGMGCCGPGGVVICVGDRMCPVRDEIKMKL